MNFLRRQGVILVGNQGAMMLYDLHRDQLPKGKWALSFDEKETLWKSSDGYRVPGVVAYSEGDFAFNLGYFGGDWGSDYVLVCFCDE